MEKYHVLYGIRVSSRHLPGGLYVLPVLENRQFGGNLDSVFGPLDSLFLVVLYGKHSMQIITIYVYPKFCWISDIRSSFTDIRKSFTDIQNSFTDIRNSFTDIRKSAEFPISKNHFNIASAPPCGRISFSKYQYATYIQGVKSSIYFDIFFNYFPPK